MFERVYNGEDPDDILKEINLSTPSGENPEALIKAYKWIWGQEDVNYPTGYGRAMSWEGLEKDGEKWKKSGTGLKDLLEKMNYLAASYEVSTRITHMITKQASGN